jgi:menaquinone-dependent protoporphyrinogen oxidase
MIGVPRTGRLMVMSHRVLVLYASTHGHTGKIAERIGTTLTTHGVSANVRDVHSYGEHADLDKYEAVIVGASVHVGHHQSEMLGWLGRHHTRLDAMPSAFFSVSLTAADDSDEARATTRELIDDVLDASGWTPRESVAFAGALQFKEYNLPTRVIMRLMARRIEHQTGTSIDVHEDTDYTDWAAVDRFAEAFAASLRTTEVPS